MDETRAGGAAAGLVVALLLLALLLLALLLLAGCSQPRTSPEVAADRATDPGSAAPTSPSPGVAADRATDPGSAAPTSPSPSSSPRGPSVSPTSGPAAPDVPRGAEPVPTGRILLSIPAIGLTGLRVVPYRGTADDLPGTVIQDRGHGATPRGPRGGVRPGQVGNFIVTAHRTAAGRPFGLLPSLRVGQHVLVRQASTTFDYQVTRTMTISFRSTRGRARQSAPVPGRLGVPASRPMITLSTCATPEDHAAGNFWSDALHNPEHRIDKVGVLVDVR